MTLRGRLDKLASRAPMPLPDLATALTDSGEWVVADLWPNPTPDDGGDLAASRAAQASHLTDLLEQLSESALALSDAIGRRYFSHAADGSQSLGA